MKSQQRNVDYESYGLQLSHQHAHTDAGERFLVPPPLARLLHAHEPPPRVFAACWAALLHDQACLWVDMEESVAAAAAAAAAVVADIAAAGSAERTATVQGYSASDATDSLGKQGAPCLAGQWA